MCVFIYYSYYNTSISFKKEMVQVAGFEPKSLTYKSRIPRLSHIFLSYNNVLNLVFYSVANF